MSVEEIVKIVCTRNMLSEGGRSEDAGQRFEGTFIFCVCNDTS